MSKKHALIIGINKYPFMSAKAQLRGCVNDAELIRKILVNKFNFEPSNIATCYDEGATRDAILAEMDRLTDVIEQDDIVVFHYSGHGSLCNTHSEHTDEGSGKNNCILPHDDSEPSADKKPIYREIRDDQFNDWLQKLATKTRYSTLIFDCCNSGTMTRGRDDSTQVRMVPPEARPLPSQPTSSTSEFLTKPKRGAGAWLTLSDNYVVIAACRDKQLAKERSIPHNGGTVRHGMLTYHLSHALRQAKPGTTYRDVFEPTCAGVASQVKEQNPQIEGAIDREVFGVKDIEPLRYIPVKEVNGDKLTLDGGAAHGLRRGSKWAIYPPGTKQLDNSYKIGELTVSHVGALTSIGTLNETADTPVKGARCVELESAESVEPLLVDLSEVSIRDKASLEPAIRRSKLLALADTATGSDIRASIINSSEALHIDEPTWAFFEDENHLCMPLHSVDEAGVSNILLGNLEKIARFRNVLRLDNPDPTLDVSFNLFKRTPTGDLVLANGGNCEFNEDDPIVLEITNNEKERSVFCSILWLSANREIIQFYPYRKACEEIGPGKTIRFPPGMKPLTAKLDDNYIYDVGTETCKAIFSTHETDFRWLNNEGTRSGNEKKTNVTPVNAALSGVNPTNEDEQVPGTSPKVYTQDWDAIGRSFVLTRHRPESQS